MLDLKKNILDFLQTTEDPVKLRAVIKGAGLTPSDRQLTKSLLEELMSEGKVTKTGVTYWVPQGKQQSLAIKRRKTAERGTRVGRLSLTSKGFGFLEVEDGQDWLIRESDLRGARHGDTVRVRRLGIERGGRITAEVVAIESFGLSSVLGVFEVEGRWRNFEAFGMANLSKNEMESFPDDVKDGEVGVFARRDDGRFVYEGSLGHIEDPRVDEAVTLREHNIREAFPEAVISECNKLGRNYYFDPEGRTDFRDELVFTIDGADARDFDDALHVKELEEDLIEVGIHIADAAHFVTEGSELDQEARLRGNSVYLPHKAIPMLPHLLSTNLCSLNPGVDRYTLSVVVRLNGDGEVQSYDISKGIICSKYRLTYREVDQACLEEDEALRERLAEVVPSLERLLDLSRRMKERRTNAGGLVIDVPETKVVLDENHVLTSVESNRQTDSNRMIEAFMVLANEVVGTHMEERGIGIPYRIHEPPDYERVESLVLFLQSFGIDAPKDIFLKTGQSLNQVIQQLQDHPGARVLQTQVLKSLKLAEYNSDNRGHFGLASTTYAHFTSPIRRYADMLVHRRLTTLLANPEMGPEHFNDADLNDACDHISKTERNAMAAEKSFTRVKLLRHVRAHEVGNEYEGVIEEVKQFGMFVGLEELNVSGLVHLEEFKDDYYDFNPETLSLVGRRKGRVMQVGDTLKVKIVRADLITRKMDLFLVELPEHKDAPQKERPRGRGGAGGPHRGRKIKERSGRKKVSRTLSSVKGKGKGKKGGKGGKRGKR